ncbi:ATP-grasp domain-containing protein [Bacillus sp. 2205SS5-2]|uniref:ATP-grasp domain-containing protein n=1 Tax=Bacillus sp. 2205SS5-2 TaxID=3109031 RepID=UPI0030067192
MKIWFNRWFTTVTHYIDSIRTNPDNREITIYGTHPNPDAAYLQNCDYKATEPDCSGEEYLQFCLEFCQQHYIDVFVPRKENVFISQHIHLFEELGVKVLVCPDAKLMMALDDKAETYKLVKKSSQFLCTLPYYYIVNSVEEFQQAYHALRTKGHTVCFKPAIGEGANGFRVIKEENDSISDLFSKGIGYRITYKQACEILSSEETFPNLMVLEFLDGPEYSIDCLGYEDELIVAIPRKKGNGRIRELEENQELIEMAKRFQKELRLSYAYNIQVKYKEDVPKLLEINPRMSGGLHMSCLSGVNIPYYAIKLLLEEEVMVPPLQYNLTITHIEKAIVLEAN